MKLLAINGSPRKKILPRCSRTPPGERQRVGQRWSCFTALTPISPMTIHDPLQIDVIGKISCRTEKNNSHGIVRKPMTGKAIDGSCKHPGSDRRHFMRGIVDLFRRYTTGKKVIILLLFTLLAEAAFTYSNSIFSGITGFPATLDMTFFYSLEFAQSYFATMPPAGKEHYLR